MNGNTTAQIPIQSVIPTKHEKTAANVLPPFTTSDDLYARDELRERELEEARARASQMEKTMRWWSDCTANWREKWGKVRAERNKAREENRQLKLKLEAAAKEISNLKREKLAAIEVQSKLEREIEKLERELRKDKRSIPSARVEPSPKDDSTDYVDSGLNNSSVYEKTVPKLGGEKQFIEQILQKNELYETKYEDASSFERSHSVPSDDRKRSRSNSAGSRKKKSQTESLLENESSHKLSLVQMKLEETEKLLADERSSKQNLLEELDNLQADLTDLKFKNEEIKMSYQDSSSQLTRIRNKYEKEVQELNADLEDAYSSNNSSGNVKKISDLRGEIERLQSENSLEWSKREKLESEKLVLERENKKLRIQMEDLLIQLDESSKSSKALSSVDIKQFHAQLEEKNRELQELKVAYSKVRKQLQEKAEELSHSRKRLEHHENEVRKLRTRVEELKVDLSKAEDELDSQTGNLRKLQRNLDEETERADSYKVQLEHLNSRLRMGGNTAPALKTRYTSGRKSSLQLSSEESDDDTPPLD